MKKVHTTKGYYRVRQRSPSQFKLFRVPRWTSNVAGSVSKGSKIVMGKTKKTNKWRIQSIIIAKRKGLNKLQAVKLAKRIRTKLE
jgi:hypothetical protein